LKGGRRVDVMLMLVNEDQEILHLKEDSKEQFIDFPRGHMSTDAKIVEEEEDPMETGDDESADDETYRMSPMPPSENNVEDDVESDESGLRKKCRKRWLRGSQSQISKKDFFQS
jgi:hypothetical protein